MNRFKVGDGQIICFFKPNSRPQTERRDDEQKNGTVLGETSNQGLTVIIDN